MAFNVKGFRTHDFMFHPCALAGTNLCLRSYLTNDDAPTVETTGYFAALASTLKPGDHIDMTLDLDATPVPRIYAVATSGVAGVTIAPDTGGVPEFITINGVLGRLLTGIDGQPLTGFDGQFLYGAE